MTAIEDLIAQNQATYGTDLMAARAVPRDGQATADLKGDPDKLARLAELAEVEPDKLVEVAVRGTNVSFQVADEKGVVSAGFFPLVALDSKRSTSRARATGTVRTRTPVEPAPKGGAATVPTVATVGDNAGDPDADDLPVPPAEGVPADIDSLSGDKVAELLKDTPDGVDAAAVLAHEQQREGGMRTAVERAARKLGMLEPATPPPA